MSLAREATYCYFQDSLGSSDRQESTGLLLTLKKNFDAYDSESEGRRYIVFSWVLNRVMKVNSKICCHWYVQLMSVTVVKKITNIHTLLQEGIWIKTHILNKHIHTGNKSYVNTKTNKNAYKYADTAPSKHMPTSKSHSLQLHTEPPLQRTVNSMCPAQHYLTIICLILQVKVAENVLGTRKYKETKIIWRDRRSTHWPGAFVQRGICFVLLLKRKRMDRTLTSFILTGSFQIGWISALCST